MAHTAEALTDTDHAILRAYGTGGQVTDIATTHKLTREDVGFRLAELCGLDRGRARELSPLAPATPATSGPGIDQTRVTPVDLTEPASRILTDREQEVMRSFGGGNDIHVIAKAKRMEPAEIDGILKLVGHARLKAATAGRTGVVTAGPPATAPAPKPRPATPPPAAGRTPAARPTPAPAAAPEPTAGATPTLSPRQTAILRLLATNLDFDDIAGQLGIAISTAYGLASGTYRALGAGSRAGAVAAATRLGILTAPGPPQPASGRPDTAAKPAEPDTDDGPDLAAIIAEQADNTTPQAPPADPTEPAPDPTPAATHHTPVAGPTVEITIIRAGRTWTTTVELDPDDADTTVNVRVRPPAGTR